MDQINKAQQQTETHSFSQPWHNQRLNKKRKKFSTVGLHLAGIMISKRCSILHIFY